MDRASPMAAAVGALRPQRMAVAVLLAMSLGACGGGGGSRPSGGNTSPPPNNGSSTQPPQPPVDAQIALTHTASARAAGLTGQGTTIAIIDTGVMRNHPALAGRVTGELIYVDPKKNNTAVDDVAGHGTWVSELAAGVPFAKFAGGIAPGANLVSARIISDTDPKDDGSGQGNAVTAADADFFGQTLNPAMIQADAKVQNNSWGGIYWDTSNASINTAFANAYRPYVKDFGGLVVFAAGNDGRADPSDIAALPSLAPDLASGWLVAVALDSNAPTKLASYSNACGKARNYCLAAPGDLIVSGKDDTAAAQSYYVVQGTSFAAPQVSGAAALVWQAYPYFNADLVRQTLLGTATDLGTPGPDATFGYGALNVGAAVNGPAKFDFGDVTVNFSGASSWNNPISGTGGLIKQGDGSLTLAQPSSFTGLTDVQGGVLIAKSLAGNVAIRAGATLAQTHGIGGGLGNDGVLDVSGGDVSVGGNYVQTGRLALELGSALRVAGMATLEGGDLYVDGAGSGYVAHAHTDVLSAAKGLNGTFEALDAAPGVLLDASLHYDANNAWLDVNQVQATQVRGASYTAASMASAQRVQGAFDQLNRQIATGGGVTSAAGFADDAARLQRTATAQAFQRSLESLSGQLHASSAAMAFESIDAGTRALSDRFDRLLDAPQAGGGWSQSLGYHGGMSRSGFRSVGYDLDGVLLGQDVRLAPGVFAGYAISQSQGLGRLSETADQGHSHALEGMLYGGLLRGNTYVMGRFGVGDYRQTMHRNLLLGPAYEGVGSDSRGRYGVAYGEGGYRLGLGAIDVTPYVNVQYAQMRDDGFDEQGAGGFGLRADERSIRRWQAGAGLRAGRSWKLAHGGEFAFSTRVLWQHAMGRTDNAWDASFTGLDQYRALSGVGLSRYGTVFGATLDWSFRPGNALSLGYDAERSEYGHLGNATLAYRVAF